LNENHKNQVKEFHPTIEEEKEVAPKIYTTKRGDKISWKAKPTTHEQLKNTLEGVTDEQELG